MNSAPHSIAENLGKLYRKTSSKAKNRYSVGQVRDFLQNLESHEWQQVCPERVALSGEGYKRVWPVLTGESI